MAATYDLGCAIYFAVPTAPPWWAAEQGYIEQPVEQRPTEVAADREAPHVRRIMVDAGEQVWGTAWQPLYDSLNGNPWAAMPSLHFATSLMAALHLAEVGPGSRALRAGATRARWASRSSTSASTTSPTCSPAPRSSRLVRRGEPLAEPVVDAVNRVLQRLERIAAA